MDSTTTHFTNVKSPKRQMTTPLHLEPHHTQWVHSTFSEYPSPTSTTCVGYGSCGTVSWVMTCTRHWIHQWAVRTPSAPTLTHTDTWHTSTLHNIQTTHRKQLSTAQHSTHIETVPSLPTPLPHSIRESYRLSCSEWESVSPIKCTTHAALCCCAVL